MSTRGAKPKPPFLHLVTGNPGRRPINIPTRPESREGPLKPPRKLTKAQAALWARFIDAAHWLTDFDAPKAYQWVCLQARHNENPADFKGALHGQLRLLASDLALDPSSRSRLGIATKQSDDPNEKYFN